MPLGCRLLAVSAVVAIGLSSTSATAVAEVGTSRDQLIVEFEAGAGRMERARAHQVADAVVVDRIVALRVEVVRVADAEAALDRYRRSDTVRGVEVDTPAWALHDDCTTDSTSCLVPNDPYRLSQWGVQNDYFTLQPSGTIADHDADVDAPRAWQRTTGSTATRIAILDSGIDLDHEDLAAKVVDNHNVTKSRTPDDKYGHGTAVAGVAAPIADNGTGVVGVGFHASLMNVKVLDDRGIGSCSTVAKGITWAADNGAHVINLSLGFSDCTAGHRAVDYAWNKGALLTAAAGNDGDQSATYPAYYANVMAVAATDNADAKTSFSQYGDWVDIAAPGVNVYTTFPNHSNRLGKTHYDYGKGTSMSAPFVAGAAGLIWSTVADGNGNGQTNDEVRARLEIYADKIPGTGTLWSSGRLNACNAAGASDSACPLG